MDHWTNQNAAELEQTHPSVNVLEASELELILTGRLSLLQAFTFDQNWGPNGFRP